MKSNKVLSELLLKYKNKAFKWGEADCCLFGCDCIQMQTGINLFDRHFGMYNSEISAKKYVKKIGGIEANLDKYLHRIDPMMMRRGDVALCQSEQGKILTVAWQGGVLAMTKDGCRLADFPVITAWSVAW